MFFRLVFEYWRTSMHIVDKVQFPQGGGTGGMAPPRGGVGAYASGMQGEHAQILLQIRHALANASLLNRECSAYNFIDSRSSLNNTSTLCGRFVGCSTSQQFSALSTLPASAMGGAALLNEGNIFDPAPKKYCEYWSADYSAVLETAMQIL